VLAVANHLELEYDLMFCDLIKGEQRRPEFGDINPNDKVPALEDGDFTLWESNAIIQYLAALKPEGGLLPATERARADVNRWMFWDSTTWDPALAILAFERGVKGLLGLGAPDPVEIEKGTQKANAAFAILDAHLKGREFVASDRLTLADFALGSALILEQMAQLPLAPYSEIKRWGAQLSALPGWQDAQKLRSPPAAAA
ncbi:MAG TPA: glutathione S-transferase family protein, partial [Candidatus Binatia bacterium]|nr:glutathione S-transferase family protein [Candidatus Binatia bacterium]